MDGVLEALVAPYISPEEHEKLEKQAEEIYTDLVNSDSWEPLMNKLLMHALDKLQDEVTTVLLYKIASNTVSNLDIVKIVSDTIEHL